MWCRWSRRAGSITQDLSIGTAELQTLTELLGLGVLAVVEATGDHVAKALVTSAGRACQVVSHFGPPFVIPHGFQWPP